MTQPVWEQPPLLEPLRDSYDGPHWEQPPPRCKHKDAIRLTTYTGWTMDFCWRCRDRRTGERSEFGPEPGEGPDGRPWQVGLTE